jgi:hypothetical protein
VKKEITLHAIVFLKEHETEKIEKIQTNLLGEGNRRDEDNRKC